MHIKKGKREKKKMLHHQNLYHVLKLKWLIMYQLFNIVNL